MKTNCVKVMQYCVSAYGEIPADERCGGLYCKDSSPQCSSDCNISFSYTNTTYTDGDGNAEGVTAFVVTDCITIVRLNRSYQDVGYDTKANVDGELDLSLPSSVHNASPFSVAGTPLSDPLGEASCQRGCFCGYLSQQMVLTLGSGQGCPTIFAIAR